MSRWSERLAMLRLASAFLRTRYLAWRLKTRDDLVAWQGRRLRRWLEHVVPRVDFYAERARRLEDLPIVDKSVLMQNFDKFNTAHITAAEGWAAFESGQLVRGYTVGASTGTSGNRGLFVISEGERFEWLGVLLAKVLPNFPFERARVALILPLNTRLYGAAGRTGLIDLKFFNLRDGLAGIGPDLARFAPDTIIAPPKVLRHLAETQPELRPKRLLSGAEVLDPLDRAAIEAGFGVTVREIYMATEGLLGVACEHGTLHLVEDAVHFEWERPFPGSALVTPIISDFTRQTQVMARYRMNDLLLLRQTPCPCGSPLQAVARIQGRSDDVFDLPGTAGTERVMVTPDILRNAIVDSHRGIADFRLVQVGEARIELTLLQSLPEAAVAAAKAALAATLAGAGARAEIGLALVPNFDLASRKLRRVERRWQKPPGGKR